MTQPLAIVTGASAGIGQAIARGLLDAGHRVVIASRDPGRFVDVPTASVGAPTGSVGTPTRRIERWPLDLADLASVRAFANRVRTELPAPAVLVCNAGIWPRRRQLNGAGLELGFAVNHVGHAALALALEPHLAAGARVVTLASGLHAAGRIAWDDPTFARDFADPAAYAQSKLANVMFSLAFARRFPRLRSNAIHPGLVRTALHGERPPASAITASAAARGPLRLAWAAEHATTTGRYFDQLVSRRPSALALDRASQDRLWSLTEVLIRRRK